MMKFRSKAIGGLVLAVAGVTALAACSSSSPALTSAVAMVSTKPHRNAAAIIANRKKTKKILLGGSVNRHNSAGQATSLTWAHSTNPRLGWSCLGTSASSKIL